MKSGGKNLGKELYKQLRRVSCAELWKEIELFDRSPAQERMERVGLVRAAGVVFSETGTVSERDKIRIWLRGLLHDPSEKIRRYAIAALPKVGSGEGEEAELLTLLRTTEVEREKKFLGQTLEKIGGKATLEELGSAPGAAQIEQKVKASLARNEAPSEIRFDRELGACEGLKIHLRGRRGLEEIVRGELEEFIKSHGKFRVTQVREGLVALVPIAAFSLGDIYQLRTFGFVGFDVGGAATIDGLSSVITSPLARSVFNAFTDGTIRYRLEFPAKGHQRSAVRSLANQVYARCPEILNSPQDAPWTVSILSKAHGYSVELVPRQSADPRFSYRQLDVPAASHPPLAASMARLAGPLQDAIIWDPFCGSGLELIERALLGGVQKVYGTDRSGEAVAIADSNFTAANLPLVQARFICCDFREFAKIEGLGANSLTLVISNPPLGKRVPIPNLRGLMEDLFIAAAGLLRPGGKLVFANPVRMDSPDRSLRLESRRVIDFGGFDCRLEVYLKVAPGSSVEKSGATSRVRRN